MPLKLIPPKPGKTPNWYIRGTYLRRYVEESTGTPVKALAQKLLNQRKEQIERGELEAPVALPEIPEATAPTFLAAAVRYISAGGDGRFLGRYDPHTCKWSPGIIVCLGEKLLADIDQAAIDDCAAELYPAAPSATRNRQVYTPISAVLKHAGIEKKIKRPKGWRGQRRIHWLQPELAFRVFEAAKEVDSEFQIFLMYLTYTGPRLSEGLRLTCDRLSLREAFGVLQRTKNTEPRLLHLPPVLVAALANHPRGLDRGKQKVFRFTKSGRLYELLGKVKEKIGTEADFIGFHTFRHTWGAWMRRYGGLDTTGLVATGAWRSRESAAIYEHAVAAEEAIRADLLPTPPGSEGTKRETGGKSGELRKQSR